ncbi:chorismate mutase [Zopfochytrium polystomum]|nr:chorismate mutase [Zopfochytrium polystomum]
MYFGEPLTLARIRDELVKMEDAVIFALIERATFAQNLAIYDPKRADPSLQFGNGFDGSFLDYLLLEMESIHAKVRRYTSPEEYPFSSPPHELPAPILPPLDYPRLLYPNTLNFNSTIKQMYLDNIVPSICKPGDDKNYGSAATHDVDALQVLSRRIHFGKFVAEAKFQDPKTRTEYVRLIQARDAAGIDALLTNKQVEARLLRRVRKKALVYGQEVGDDDATGHLRVPVEVVADLYEKHIIPLTKQVEVDYLLGRLDEPHAKGFVPDNSYGF